MKKMTFKTSAMAAALAGVLAFGAVACGGNKYKSIADAQTDEQTEQADQQSAVEPLEQVKSQISDSTLMKKYNAAFFQNNANKSDKASADKWAETPSGLRYAIIAPGQGTAPTAQSNVTVHYTGYLTNGTVFDSSISRGEPASFPLNGVIPGWTEGLQLLKPGGAAAYYIPGKLAYGENGQPQAGIGPNETLIFLVELLSVN